jgi:hypothetical protein
MLDAIHRIKPAIKAEAFEDGVLLLNPRDRTTMEFDRLARDVIKLTDGKRSVKEIALLLSSAQPADLETVSLAITDVYDKLASQGIIEAIHYPYIDEGVQGMTQNPVPTDFYLCNPDVVLREEDEDGGLLFNPDTNDVRVINATGLFIWKECQSQQEPAAIIKALQVTFEDAPLESVTADVQEFLADMLHSGFIGKVIAQ